MSLEDKLQLIQGLKKYMISYQKMKNNNSQSIPNLLKCDKLFLQKSKVGAPLHFMIISNLVSFMKKAYFIFISMHWLRSSVCYSIKIWLFCNLLIRSAQCVFHGTWASMCMTSRPMGGTANHLKHIN